MKLVLAITTAIVVIIFLVLIGTTGFYILENQFFFWELPAKGSQSIEWANFGAFVGGVASPALMAVSGVVLVLSFLLQVDVASRAYQQSSMTASYASLHWVREKLDHVLKRPVRTNGASVQSIVIGHSQGSPVTTLEPDEERRFIELAPELVYWLGAAVEQMELFRKNQEDHAFTLQHERRFYEDVLKFLEYNQASLLGRTSSINLGMIRTHFISATR